MVCVPLAHWADSIDTEWYLGDNYHPSIKVITIDMALKQVVLIGKVIGHVCRGVFDVALLSNIDDSEFNEMTVSGNDTPSTREGDAAASGYTSEGAIEPQDTDGEGDEEDSSSDEGGDDEAED
eukprot:4224258-Ditylum_brightwellii.AAC.1